MARLSEALIVSDAVGARTNFKAEIKSVIAEAEAELNVGELKLASNSLRRHELRSSVSLHTRKLRKVVHDVCARLNAGDHSWYEEETFHSLGCLQDLKQKKDELHRANAAFQDEDDRQSVFLLTGSGSFCSQIELGRNGSHDLMQVAELQKPIRSLEDFLERASQDRTLLKDCTFDKDDAIALLLQDVLDRIKYGILWRSAHDQKMLLKTKDIAVLFVACCWKSAAMIELEGPAGQSSSIAFYELLQQARRSAEDPSDSYSMYYRKFMGNDGVIGLAQWQEASRYYRNNILPHFDIVPLESSTLWRGSSLDDKSVQWFESRHQDGAFFDVPECVATSLSRNIAIQFIEDQWHDAAVKGDSVTLFQLHGFHAHIAHIDLRMFASRESKADGTAEDEVLLDKPRASVRSIQKIEERGMAINFVKLDLLPRVESATGHVKDSGLPCLRM